MSTLEICFEIVKIVISLLVVVALILTGRQIKLAKSSMTLNSIKTVYDENIIIRGSFDKALEQQNKLIDIINRSKLDSDKFYYVYGNKEYEELRNIGYHYEYIGLLIRNRVLSFDILFNLIPFPDRFWKDSIVFVSIMRDKYFPDFWENFEYLKKQYDHFRKI